MANIVFKKLSDNSFLVVPEHSQEFRDICCSSEVYLFIGFDDDVSDEVPEDYYPHVQY